MTMEIAERPCAACRRIGPCTRSIVLVPDPDRTLNQFTHRVGFKCHLCGMTLLVTPEQADDPATLERIHEFIGTRS